MMTVKVTILEKDYYLRNGILYFPPDDEDYYKPVGTKELVSIIMIQDTVIGDMEC